MGLALSYYTYCFFSLALPKPACVGAFSPEYILRPVCVRYITGRIV